MANELNLFDLRSMLRALEQRVPPKTFFLDTFFPSTEVHDTDTVDIDIIQGKRKMAPFVNPRLQGKLVERTGYTTRTYKPPYLKPKMVTTAAELMKRMPGSTIYGGNVSPAQRAAEQLGRDLAELEDMIVRREEWMASTAVTSGQIRVIGDGIDDTITFGMQSSHLPVLSGGSLWSAPTTATPIDDLRDWKRQVLHDSGIAPTDCVMGIEAYEAFLKCNQVSDKDKGLFDFMRINLGQIEPRALPNGLTYVGRLTELGLDLWVHEDWYVTDFDDDVEEAMMPPKKVLLGSRNARTTRHYALIQDLEVSGALKRFPKSWAEKDPSAQFLLVQSAPLMVPHQVDAFLCATVLA
jgi:hypothetical protein